MNVTTRRAAEMLATMAPDPKARAHRRAVLRELAMTHCPDCSAWMSKRLSHSTRLRLSCGPTCPSRNGVDDVVVARLLDGSPVTSTRGERIEAVRVLTARGRSASWIADYLHTTRRSIERYRAELTNRKQAVA